MLILHLTFLTTHPCNEAIRHHLDLRALFHVTHDLNLHPATFIKELIFWQYAFTAHQDVFIVKICIHQANEQRHSVGICILAGFRRMSLHALRSLVRDFRCLLAHLECFSACNAQCFVALICMCTRKSTYLRSGEVQLV